MAKTVTAVLVGELVADGKLALDAPAPVAEWQGAADPRRAITLRQLLNMASGLAHTEVGDPVEASDTNQVLFVSGTGDMATRAMGMPLETEPGANNVSIGVWSTGDMADAVVARQASAATIRLPLFMNPD